MNDLELEAMVLRLMGDGSSYINMLQTAQSTTREAADNIEAAAGRIVGLGGTMRAFATTVTTALASIGLGFSALGSVIKGVGLAAEAEKNEIAFGTMLQSMDKGKQMVKDLQDFAAATPMNTQDIQMATKTLLQFGTAGKDILPTLKMIGDATGGDAFRFRMMSLAFGQMSASGRLMGQDLLQMINAGFNPLMEISRKTGKSMATLKQEMEKGKITVDMIKDAFKTATGEGGQFFGLMEKQSKSLSGLFSTMQDDIGGFLRVVGQDIVELFGFKQFLMGVSGVAKFFTDIIKDIHPTLKSLVVLVGGASAAIVAIGITWQTLGGWGTAVSIVNLLAKGFGPLISGVVGLSLALRDGTISLKTIRENMELYTTGTKVAAVATMALKAALLGIVAIGSYQLGKFLGETFTDAGKAVGDLEVELKRANGQLKVWEERTKRGVDKTIAEGMALPFGERAGFFEKELEKANKAVEEHNKFIAHTNKQLKENRETARGWFTSFADATTANANAKDLLGDLERQNTQLEVAKDNVEALRKELNKFSEVPPEIKNAITDLQEKIFSMGMTEGQKTLFKLRGFPTEQLEHVRRLTEDFDRAKKSFDAHKKLEEDKKKLMEEGKSMAESILGADPMRKFEMRMAKLHELLKAEAITMEVFKLGAQQAQVELDKAGKHAERAAERFDAAAFGSVEALTRIQEFRDKTRDQFHSRISGGRAGQSGSAQFEAAKVNTAAGGPPSWTTNNLLQEMRDLMRLQVKKPSLEVTTAGLA